MAICLPIVFSGQSVTIDAAGDSVVNGMKLRDIRKIYTAAEQKKELQVQLAATEERLEVARMQLKLTQDKNTSDSTSYKEEIASLERDKITLTNQIADKDREIKRLKRGRFVDRLVGTLATIGSLLLFITKK